MTTSVFQSMCSATPLQMISVNGVPLHTLGRVEQTWEGVLGAPELIGSASHLPLRPGALHIPQVTGAREFGVGMLIHGDNDKDEAGHNDRWRALARLLWSPMQPLAMQRRIATGAGPETHECSAKYVSGLDPAYVTGRAMSRLALRILNLDGYWYGQANTTATVAAGGAATLTLPGDAETRRMTITFSGASGGVQTLTNATNGCVLSYVGATDPEVNLDVFGFTANQEGTNVLRNVTHAGDVFWMRLQPGINALQLTGGGTATVRARATYL